MAELKVQLDRQLIPAGRTSHRHMLLTLVAPELERDPSRKRPPLNLALVLDRSGSMAGDKLALVKQAVTGVLGRLQDTDRFSVVVYNESVDDIAGPTTATGTSRREAFSALERIDAMGGTDLHAGWMRGCEHVARNIAGDTLSRTLLLTDGLANHGVTEFDVLLERAASLKGGSVGTTTFGVGADFDDALLQGMADRGGGHYYHVQEPAQIEDFVTSEVGELLNVVSRDAALIVRFPPGLEAAVLSPFQHAWSGEELRIALGDLVSGQCVEVVLRLDIAPHRVGQVAGLEVEAVDRDGVVSTLGVSRPYLSAVDPSRSNAESVATDVERAAASVYAACARQRAIEKNRRSNFDAASDELVRAAERISSLAVNDPDLWLLVSELRRDAVDFGCRRTEDELKPLYYVSSTTARSRNIDGSAKRREP